MWCFFIVKFLCFYFWYCVLFLNIDMMQQMAWYFQMNPHLLPQNFNNNQTPRLNPSVNVDQHSHTQTQQQTHAQIQEIPLFNLNENNNNAGNNNLSCAVEHALTQNNNNNNNDRGQGGGAGGGGRHSNSNLPLLSGTNTNINQGNNNNENDNNNNNNNNNNRQQNVDICEGGCLKSNFHILEIAKHYNFNKKYVNYDNLGKLKQCKIALIEESEQIFGPEIREMWCGKRSVGSLIVTKKNKQIKTVLRGCEMIVYKDLIKPNDINMSTEMKPKRMKSLFWLYILLGMFGLLFRVNDKAFNRENLISFYQSQDLQCPFFQRKFGFIGLLQSIKILGKNEIWMDTFIHYDTKHYHSFQNCDTFCKAYHDDINRSFMFFSFHFTVFVLLL